MSIGASIGLSLRSCLRAGAARLLRFPVPDGTGLIQLGDWESNRSTNTVVEDHEGVYRTLTGNMIPFKAARVVHNLATELGKSDFSVWGEVGTAVIGAPDGNGASVITGITASAANRIHAQLLFAAKHDSLDGKDCLATLWVKGTGSDIGKVVKFVIRRRTGGDLVSMSVNYTLTSEFVRISVGPITGVTDNVGLNIWLYSGPSDSAEGCVVKDWQAEEVTGQAIQYPGEDVAVVGSGTGDGIALYATSNGNTVSGAIVTEAMGVALDPAPFITHSPAATNYADGEDDLSGGPETIDFTPWTGTFTLSVYGSAAVTVAAGTAVGSGFGQATEGSPVTFSLSATGTITLTLDSGTLDLHYDAAMKQVEAGLFASSFIPTFGAAATRNKDETRYPFSAEMFNQAEGMLTLKFVPEYAKGDVGSAIGLIAIRDNLTSIIHFNATVLGRSIDADVNTTTVNEIFVAGNQYIFGVRWSTTANELQIGIKDVDGDGLWIWDATPGAYGGTFTVDSYLNLGFGNTFTNEFHALKIYDRDKGTDWIEAHC